MVVLAPAIGACGGPVTPADPADEPAVDETETQVDVPDVGETDQPPPARVDGCYFTTDLDCQIESACDGQDRLLTLALGWLVTPAGNVALMGQVSFVARSNLTDPTSWTWTDFLPEPEVVEFGNVVTVPALPNGEYIIAARYRALPEHPWVTCLVGGHQWSPAEWLAEGFQPPCGEDPAWEGFDPLHMRVLLVDRDPNDPTCAPIGTIRDELAAGP